MCSKIEICFAELKDKTDIIHFIQRHWDVNHILVKHTEVFDYQYIINNKLNFVIAKDHSRNKIYGICGFVPFNRKGLDICQALWRAIPCCDPMVGIHMLEFLRENSGCRFICCNGINESIIPIHELLGNHVDKLRHFYRLNDLSFYEVAVVKRKKIPDTGDTVYTLVNISHEQKELILRFCDQQPSLTRPYKDSWYIDYRYFEHPFYEYLIWGIRDREGILKGALFTREIAIRGAKILRIVDYVGPRKVLEGISEEIQRILCERAYEYIDFYCFGIDERTMERAGFCLRDNDDPNIIPNYFEPFIQSNTDIYFFSESLDNFRLCKADGDQDRPNFLMEVDNE